MAEKQAVVFDDENVFILQNGLNLYVKLSDLVAFLGVSKQYIGELVNKGAIISGNYPNYLAEIGISGDEARKRHGDGRHGGPGDREPSPCSAQV